MSWEEALEDDRQTLRELHKSSTPMAYHDDGRYIAFAANQHALLDLTKEKLIVGKETIEAYFVEHNIDPFHCWYCERRY